MHGPAHNVLRVVRPVRPLILIVLAAACAGPIRPVVINKLSELPGDAQKRDAVLDSAQAQPGPEQRSKLPPKLKTAETVAATAAAVIGTLFSKTKNVTLGSGGAFEETLLFERKQRTRRAEETESAPPPPPEEPIDGATLVPWVRLR